MPATEWYGAAAPYDPTKHLEHLLYQVRMVKKKHVNSAIDEDAYMSEMRGLRARGVATVSAILDTPSARHDARFMMDGFDDALRDAERTRAPDVATDIFTRLSR